MADVTPFLDAAQFEAMFRPLSPGEKLLAETLLKAAAILIRQRVAAAGRDPLAADDPMAILVSWEVTKAVFPAVPDLEGRTSYSITTDDRTEQGTLASAAGLLDFDDRHWALLGLSATATPTYGGMNGDFGPLGGIPDGPAIRCDLWLGQ
ncbi:phage Gp19/Gp15/Gp42 family protein [Mycobacteriaceae bacterium Msp059]|nr:phage Gp19/Gp15/Gp42 family protein [Mycobacteriaceae bacterium Msp059]